MTISNRIKLFDANSDLSASMWIWKTFDLDDEVQKYFLHYKK